LDGFYAQGPGNERAFAQKQGFPVPRVFSETEFCLVQSELSSGRLPVGLFARNGANLETVPV